MRLNRNGATREVLLIGPYAIKIPSLREWRLFLHGLLANMQEKNISRLTNHVEGFCPVLFSLPGGLLVVMPRVRVMTDEEYEKFDYESLVDHPDYRIPAEDKSDSFGWLNGQVVAIDYGN